MSAPFPGEERITDLLVLRAIEGLDREGEEELEQLTVQEVIEDADAFDRVAASLALNQLEPEPLPEELRERIKRDAGIWFSARDGANVHRLETVPAARPPEARTPLAATAGWWAAAAGVAMAAVGLWRAEDAARAY